MTVAEATAALVARRLDDHEATTAAVRRGLAAGSRDRTTGAGYVLGMRARGASRGR